MKTETVRQTLGEADVHLRDIIARIDQKKMETDDEATLAVELGQVLDHLCLAWHCREMTPKQKAGLETSEYIRLSNEVPDFGGERRIARPET